MPSTPNYSLSYPGVYVLPITHAQGFLITLCVFNLLKDLLIEGGIHIMNSTRPGTLSFFNYFFSYQLENYVSYCRYSVNTR